MKTKQIYYGAAYYDEYMPYDRIETDFAMMEKAGMNIIRIAESTWSTWEPVEGEFEFEHLHRMLDCAKKHNLKVIVGTPTYAIPSWLADKDDTILALTHNGQEIYGHRQNMDITNPTYRRYAKRMIERLMEEVADDPCVIGYQLDNETKSYDTCSPRAQAMFVDKLREEWPDILEFNREFGLDYWSNRVDEWEHFPDIRGTINQSLAAEYAKFQRGLVTDFLAWQAEIVKRYKRPDQFITQNFDFAWTDHSYGLQPEVDQYQACQCMDVAGADIYHPSAGLLTGAEITVCGNIARSLFRDNYLILETEAQGNPGWLPYPGQLRLQAYSHIANGANSVMYWHWHSIHNAIESYWKGVLSHDLSENATYRDCMVIGNELKEIGSQIKNLKKNNKLAIAVSNEALTAMRLFPLPGKGDHSYNAVLRWFADALFHMNLEYDIIPCEASLLSSYDCVILPTLYAVPEEYLKALDRYVAEGGNLIASFKTAFSDEHMKIYADTQPHILHETFGIRYDQFTIPMDVTITYNDIRSEATEWIELVSCTTAESQATYNHPAWSSYSAITKNHYGKGQALYLATLFNEEMLRGVLANFLMDIGFEEEEKIPSDAFYPLCVKQGTNDEGRHILYLLNYSYEEQTATNLGGTATDLLTGETIAAGEPLHVEPWGLKILRY